MSSQVKLEAPDGELLSITDKKKAEWYVKRGLGILIEDSEDAYIVRLKFEPQGRNTGYKIIRKILSNITRTTNIVKVKLLAPNGDILRAGDCGLKHKAEWYVRKKLGKVVTDDSESYIVKLNFVPSGR